MLTVLVSTLFNSQVFFLKKMWVAFAHTKATHISFSKNSSIYAILNDQSFKDMLATLLVLHNWAQYNVLVHILSPVTDNCPFLNQRNDRKNDFMISMKVMWPSWDSNLQHLNLLSNSAATPCYGADRTDMSV